MAHLLDVTLRDGGYQNRFHFSSNRAGKLTSDLSSAGIDFIEVGYKKGSLKPIPGIGPSGLCDLSYLETIRLAAPSAQIAVMVHPHNIVEEDLLEMRLAGVDMIRVCINQNSLSSTFKVIQKCKDLQFITTANITRASSLAIDRILNLATFAECAGADVVYFADSNGNLVPQDVRLITDAICKTVAVSVGFHAHNNLSLALSNSLAALEEGASFIDSSLKGMGKGAGNLATEVYAAYSHRVGSGGNLNLTSILELAHQWEKEMKGCLPVSSTEELFLGAGNFSADFVPLLREVAQKENISWSALAVAVSKDLPKVAQHSEIQMIASQIKETKEATSA